MRWSRAAIVLWALPAGCLAEGGPGVGRQVLAERGVADVAFAPAAPGAFAPRVLFTRSATAVETTETAAQQARDLYLLAPDDGEPRLAASGLAPQVRSTFFWDARGRLYLHRDIHREPLGGAGVDLVHWDLLRVDLDGGAPVSLGRVRAERLSPGRMRLHLATLDGPGLVLRIADDVQLACGSAVRQTRFEGEELFFADREGLSRLPADAEAPQLLVPRATAFRPINAPLADLLARRPTADGKDVELVLVQLGPSGATLRPLVQRPIVGDPFVSPDRARLAWLERTSLPDQLILQVTSLGNGPAATAPVSERPASAPDPSAALPSSPPPSIDISFRPQTEEVWAFVEERLFVLRPQGLTTAERVVHTFTRIGPGRAGDRLADDLPARGRPRGSLFTADGKRWIFYGTDDRQRLGNPDDLSDQGIAVSTVSSTGNLLELDPGRRLAVFLSPGVDRSDLYLLDLDGGGLRLLAQDVGTTLFGKQRVLAIARKLGDRRATGDLVLVELDSGAEIVLARNVSEFAVPPACEGCDPTAPGTPLAYVVQARVPWRYEGLWMGQLP
jgi:hypothetical protein